MSEYVPTIGLEIHAELKTTTKMFCRSKNDTDEKRPNVNICPVCMAHPGSLPVINKEAVRQVLRVGVVLGGKLADYTEFDRKNYFYPDIPKGYQISQYEYPLISGGSLNGVAVTRVHLEEDTARSNHDGISDETLVDFNRAGVPLMELVTEPVIQSGEQASAFAKELQLILRYLGASNADMEKGEMRIEANISVGRDGILGTKVEVKNLNSFRSVERAISYEIERQKKLIASGGAVIQETRGWNEAKQETFSQRTKEGAADYRYFPDPDLPSLKLSEVEGFDVPTLQASLPEMPEEKRSRYSAIGLRKEDVEQYVYTPTMAQFFDAVSTELGNDTERVVLASNYLSNDAASLIRGIDTPDTENKSEIPVSPVNFAKLVILVAEKKVSSRGAKDILLEMFKSDRDPAVIAEEKDLFQKNSTDDLKPLILQVIEQNPTVVTDYKNGKEAALQFLVGQGMKVSKGSANPQVVRDILIECIKQV